MTPVTPPTVTGQLGDLIQLVNILRGPDGCPWDREQDIDRVITYLQDELDEVAEAHRESHEALREELGDLLFNVVFAVELAREKGWFTMEDVIRGITEKLIRRHPHVFGEEKAETKEEALEIWKRMKLKEKGK